MKIGITIIIVIPMLTMNNNNEIEVKAIIMYQGVKDFYSLHVLAPESGQDMHQTI